MKAVIALTVILAVTCSVKSVHKYTVNETSSSVHDLLLEDKNGKLYYQDLLQPFTPLNAVAENVIIYLYTPKNLDNPAIFPANGLFNLSNTNFNASLHNFFLIHGWKNSFKSSMNAKIRSAIQHVSDANIFVVDWSVIAQHFFYPAVVREVPGIGRILGNYIYKYVMLPYSLSSSKFRLIGHSLGAHICGHAGTQIKRLAKSLVTSIVALDPPAIAFNYAIRTFLIEGIDSDDASFVQVIHTSQLGTRSPHGHADYYANNRNDYQPGCESDILQKCSHGRAYEYYAESINPSSRFTAYLCDNYSNYVSGFCNKNPRSLMGGLYVDTNASGVYYFSTNAKPPFAQG